MSRRSEKFARSHAAAARPPTGAREALERRWHKRMIVDDSLARLVTGADLSAEPFHRWLPYKQGFSPALVRRFLAETGAARPDAPIAVLDPFAGSGTTPIECARAGVQAIGVEALDVLTFLGNCAGAGDFPPLPDLHGAATWRDAAARLRLPIHRAALILAVARRFTRSGRLSRDRAPLPALFNGVVRMMLADFRTPLQPAPEFVAGDARELESIGDMSVASVLTSPPYLSRHNYSLQSRPIRRVYESWYPLADDAATRQFRASPDAADDSSAGPDHPAVAEGRFALIAANQRSAATVADAYFQDLQGFSRELYRVLGPGGIAWIVIGGARWKEVYYPSDLILAELAEQSGFRVSGVRVARRLIAAGRKLGGLLDVAPRESILILERPT